VKVTRRDPFTNKTNTVEIPVTTAQLDQWRSGGRLIQDVMRNLTDDEREFLMTGLMPESWKSIFPDDEANPKGEDLEVDKGI